MPSNIIQINGDNELTWVVPDSKMKKVIIILDAYGDKEKLPSSGAPSSGAIPKA